MSCSLRIKPLCRLATWPWTLSRQQHDKLFISYHLWRPCYWASRDTNRLKKKILTAITLLGRRICGVFSSAIHLKKKTCPFCLQPVELWPDQSDGRGGSYEPGLVGTKKGKVSTLKEEQRMVPKGVFSPPVENVLALMNSVMLLCVVCCWQRVWE